MGLRSVLVRFRSDRRAVTAIEYALIAAFIFSVVVGTVTTLGTTALGLYQSVANAF